MLGISASSYLAGVAIDLGVPARTLALVIGVVMLLPVAAWSLAMKATCQKRNESLV